MMTKKNVVIIGAAGMAREVRWMIEDVNAFSPQYEFLGYVVTDLNNAGLYAAQADILGDYDWLTKNRAKVDAVIIGIGAPAARLRVAEELKKILSDAEYPALVHPGAILDRRTATIEQGVLVCGGVIATVNVTLREFALCNWGCGLGHEVKVGRGSLINTGANISGGVEVGDGVLVSAGAQVLPYLKIGDGATVSAGAVVTKDLPPVKRHG